MGRGKVTFPCPILLSVALSRIPVPKSAIQVSLLARYSFDWLIIKLFLWNFMEVLRLLPGPAIEEIQRLPPGLQKSKFATQKTFDILLFLDTDSIF